MFPWELRPLMEIRWQLSHLFLLTRSIKDQKANRVCYPASSIDIHLGNYLSATKNWISLQHFIWQVSKDSVFVQSHMRTHVELMWLLSSGTPISWLNEMIRFESEKLCKKLSMEEHKLHETFSKKLIKLLNNEQRGAIADYFCVYKGNNNIVNQRFLLWVLQFILFPDESITSELRGKWQRC
ncbi:unnamed protein product [Lactuca saligna]|uniref:Uncharacterized protein n=1 Tax=Lactuca saligna TaxID=75948 RepID=A0AA36EA89_LACSI|nr:unnamed protein product [Lactuca saligna]